MEILYADKDIILCIKPCGVLSTDEPGGMPALLRQALGDEQADVRTVHRLDRVVGGLMVFARSQAAAAALSRQITEGAFQKEYLAVVHGCPEPREGKREDLLFRDAAENKTYVVRRMRKGVRPAALEYRVLAENGGLSLVHIHLLTGRTHQIRAQFSSRAEGFLTLDAYRTDLLYDTTFPLTKAERLDYGDSMMTHAMVITGVDLDDTGKPLRWKVENSWGEDYGEKGFYVMDEKWFGEFAFQILLNRKYFSDAQREAFAQDPIVLKPWDPMGSLARKCL